MKRCDINSEICVSLCMCVCVRTVVVSNALKWTIFHSARKTTNGKVKLMLSQLSFLSNGEQKIKQQSLRLCMA